MGSTGDAPAHADSQSPRDGACACGTPGDGAALILTEDGYRRLTKTEIHEVGDLVLYRDRGAYTHVGLIVKIQIDVEHGLRRATVMSKWGENGEYLHDMEDVPELFGKPYEWWTDRVCVKT